MEEVTEMQKGHGPDGIKIEFIKTEWIISQIKLLHLFNTYCFRAKIAEDWLTVKFCLFLKIR